MEYKDAAFSTKPSFGADIVREENTDAYLGLCYTQNEKPFNLYQSIIDYENGELEQDDTVRLFQHLINTGLAWQLQGSYGRTAYELISAGLCYR